MSPLFSVVIPVYNRAGLIRATLESVFGQTDKDYEVIVVDDGSTDDSAHVIRAYEPRIRYVFQENSGPGAARNTGIERARGEYVVFLDSDDIWFPWTLAIYRQAIVRYSMPSFLGGALFPFSDEQILNRVNIEEPRFSFYRDYLAGAGHGVFVGSCMAAVRRDILVEIGGFTMQSINAEDHDLALRLGIYPGFVFVEAPPLVGFRSHNNRVSGNLSKTIDGIRFLLDQEKRGVYPGGLTHIAERRHILAQHVRSVCLELVLNGYHRLGFELYRQTFFWQVKSGRWRFLIGFPFVFLKKQLFS